MRLRVTFAVILLALGVSTLGVRVVLAQELSPFDVMATANEQYERGEFADAAQQYQQLVDQGYEDAALYYNLGNAYFKNADLGRAIANYLRAAELSPRDSDIQANLNLARSQTVDQIKPRGDSFVISISRFSRRWVTLGELGLVSLVLWIASAVLIGMLVLPSDNAQKVIARNAAIAALTCTVISLFFFLSTLYAEVSEDQGIIIASSVDVLSGPGSQYVTEFTLHSGAEVRLVDFRQGWSRLVLPGGELQGWVPSNTLVAVEQAGDG